MKHHWRMDVSWNALKPDHKPDHCYFCPCGWAQSDYFFPCKGWFCQEITTEELNIKQFMEVLKS